MEERILVVGVGPAGLAAGIAARSRNKAVLVVGNPTQDSPLAKAERVDNYPGLPGLTGAQLLERLAQHARDMGVECINGKVNAILAWDGGFMLTVGSQTYQGSALVLAPGVVQSAKYPGEEALLGRGVSYCATCDGMLYRGREVMVVGRSKDAPEEANFLHSIGCRVTYVSAQRPAGLNEAIPHRVGHRLEVEGEQRVSALLVDGERCPCEGVFILRPAIAPADLLPGLQVEQGSIVVDRNMSTGLPGVFAAGDCTGRPYQVAKAVGEGLVAGESAAEYLETKGNN